MIKMDMFIGMYSNKTFADKIYDIKKSLTVKNTENEEALIKIKEFLLYIEHYINEIDNIMIESKKPYAYKDIISAINEIVASIYDYFLSNNNFYYYNDKLIDILLNFCLNHKEDIKIESIIKKKSYLSGEKCFLIIEFNFYKMDLLFTIYSYNYDFYKKFLYLYMEQMNDEKIIEIIFKFFNEV